ncbi:MAG: divergent PAP2 family protein [bacterium]|nr:divergent PAP2 family protein [bacterium]
MAAGPLNLPASGEWPIWSVVALCCVFAQILKVVMYSITGKKLSFAIAAQGHGLPSLPATLLSCLLVSVIAREGWRSTEAAFALVFAVIVVHDTVKLSDMADRQRAVLWRLLAGTIGSGPVRRGMADALDPRAHHPFHVVTGLVLGALFALAFVSARH